jgi:hypothetical protein
MIIESILTTMDPDGNVNFAPMGVEWGDEEIIIKPYKETTTYPNLKATGVAVINLTDNVLYIARGAISKPQFPWHDAEVVRGAVLEDACSWREVEVADSDESGDRTRFTTRVVHHGFKREFLGFNRARHAVLEAAILATRIRFLPFEHIASEFERLQVIVDKTAGPAEREAMQLLTEHLKRNAP